MINSIYYEDWRELDSKVSNSITTNSLIVCLASSTTINNIFISNNSNNDRAFYIEFDKKIIDGYTSPSINGVDISIIENSQLNATKKYLLVKNSNAKADDAFIAFSVAVFSYIEKSTSEMATLLLFEEVIKKYHDFFGFKKHLSKMEEQGLVAELLHLESAIHKYGESVVTSWYGCENNKHDFIYDDIDIEIKSSLNQEQDIIHISNENQLNSAQDKKLFLKLYIFDLNEQGYKVDSCIKTVMDIIPSFGYRKEFASKIALRGIDPSSYRGEYGFALEKVKTYIVDASFPKLTKNNVPSLIYDVKYKINISCISEIAEVV